MADWKLRLRRMQVEHIIREENMMAAQEILELFCELIAVRLPIIETQRFAPLALYLTSILQPVIAITVCLFMRPRPTGVLCCPWIWQTVLDHQLP